LAAKYGQFVSFIPIVSSTFFKLQLNYSLVLLLYLIANLLIVHLMFKLLSTGFVLFVVVTLTPALFLSYSVFELLKLTR